MAIEVASSSPSSQASPVTVALQRAEDEKTIDRALRPQTLAEYVGQERIKTPLRIAIRAAQQRGEALDHILLYGSAGLGKTTLAHIIAREMGGQIVVTSGPSIERVGDLGSLLTNLSAGDVLFIDEIHRLRTAIEEVLYPAMEDGVIDIMVGKGPSARSIQLDLPPFTLIGATTQMGMLSNPLRNRFGSTYRLHFYTAAEIAQIVQRSAALLGMQIEDDAVQAIAQRSRRTPRVANRLVRRVRDYAQAHDRATIGMAEVTAVAAMLEIDERGLDAMDRALLEKIIVDFAGGPVGVKTLAATLGEEVYTLEEVYEPYLIQEGFLMRTPRGRVALEAAFRHLQKPIPQRYRTMRATLGM